MINVFIGYDSKEVAFNAFADIKKLTKPVSITPVYLPNIVMIL